MENVKEIIAKNLVELRKSRKFTQQTLAEKLDYSDKAVSRWEHGETLPDIETLCKICDIYGVKFEYLLQKEQPSGKNPYVERGIGVLARVMITLIAVCSVWLAAMVLYAYNYELSNNYWTIFIWALPLSSLVLLVCNGLWGRRIFTPFISSFAAWTLILSFYLQFVERNMVMLFIIGIPVQLIIIFASIMQRDKILADKRIRRARRKQAKREQK